MTPDTQYVQSRAIDPRFIKRPGNRHRYSLCATRGANALNRLMVHPQLVTRYEKRPEWPPETDASWFQGSISDNLGDS